MKVLDYLLIICAFILLGIAYFLNTEGNTELAGLVNFCAIMCGVVFGSRIGGRQYKKNQENK